MVFKYRIKRLQKFPFILERNLAKANCTGNWVCTSCDTVILDRILTIILQDFFLSYIRMYFHVPKSFLQVTTGKSFTRNLSKIEKD